MKRITPYGLWVTALLSAVALVLCIIMMSHTMSGIDMAGCHGGSACSSVLSSRWALLFGIIPVSALAAGLYMAVIICCIFIVFTKDRETINMSWKVLCIFSGSITGSAIWFMTLQFFILNKFCPYCASTHAIGFVIAVIIIILAFNENCHRLKKTLYLMFFVGGIFAATMAAIQSLMPQKSSVKVYTTEQLPTFDAHQTPMLGNPNADFVVTLMFDYQCSHCRNIHSILKETVSRYSGRLAFILCPTPLSPECNIYLPMSAYDLFAGSCELSKLSLAVWKIDKDAFRNFDEWLFTPEDKNKGWYPRSVSEATMKAESLVGREKLDSILLDPWISEFMSKCMELFGRTTNNNSAGIPRMVYDSKWLIPSAESVEEMIGLLTESFGINLE